MLSEDKGKWNASFVNDEEKLENVSNMSMECDNRKCVDEQDSKKPKLNYAESLMHLFKGNVGSGEETSENISAIFS